jgi:hypothetical protein
MPLLLLVCFVANLLAIAGQVVEYLNLMYSFFLSITTMAESRRPTYGVPQVGRLDSQSNGMFQQLDTP